MKRIVLFAMLLFGAYSSKAQLKGEDFSDYSEYVAEAYDISWEKPSGFSLVSHILDFEKATHVNGMGVSPLQSMYGYGFISYDKECILLFPYMDVMGSTISSFTNARKSNKYNKLDCKKIAPKHEMETYSKEGWNELFITRLNGKKSKFNADLTTIVRTEMKDDMQKSFADYMASRYDEVGRSSEQHIKNFPEGPPRARMMFVQAMSLLYSGDRSGFLTLLKELIQKY